MRAFLLCLYSAAAVAQPNAGIIWSGLHAKNPTGIELSLRVLDPHPYREGELIRAEVRFRAPTLAPADQPPKEIWQFAGFFLDPAGDCGPVTAPCFNSMNLGFDQSDPTLRLGQAAEPISLSLNRYFPHFRPGRYRFALQMRKQVLTSRGPMSSSFGYADPPQFAVSDAIEIEVVAATDAWVAQTIATSTATLKAPGAQTPQTYAQRRIAAEQLRFLDTPAAWDASLALLPAEENTLLQGLNATRQPAKVCDLMQAAVSRPAQSVSSYYLTCMTQTCARANLPAAPVYTPPKAGQKPPEPTAEQRQYWAHHQEYMNGLIEKSVANLATSLPAKQGEAKAIAFETLMGRVQQIRNNEKAKPLPAWLPAVTAEFIQSYPKIEGFRQRQLLGLYAGTLRSQDLIPLLETAMDAWKPGDYYEASHEALQNLYAIDPTRARTRIVAELRKERTWLDSAQLAMLPPNVARFTDDELIQALAAAQRPGGWNVGLRMTALAMYASPKALPRLKAIYESQTDACQPELMAYFVRVDPPYADAVFHSHPWDFHVPAPPCTAQYFHRTPPLAMGPGLEQYLSVYLMQGDGPLKMLAAKQLGKFGSPHAVWALWDAFRYFHDYWKGKESQMGPNGEGGFLEVELRNAIARATNWLATETDLRTIESLCISERCIYETERDLEAWRPPLKIELSRWPGVGSRGQVAQYYGIESLEALEEKLTQFPKSTHFELRADRDSLDNSAAARLRKFAEEHGLQVISR